MTIQSQTVLSCQGLTKKFGGLTALNQVDLDLRKGEIVGLIGPNGSGKTTFFNVVTGIYAPTAGSVTFAGADLTAKSPQQVYRSGIARTFQRSRVCLPLSIFDNIMIGNHMRLNHGLIHNLFCRGEFRREYEQGYSEARKLVETFNPDLGEHLFEAVANFPMIDRRRIEICRALISHPKVLLLDEPSAGMTHDETRQLMDDILEVGQHDPDLAIIIIEHEMNVIERITNHCVVLNFGQKICEGAYREVAADQQVQEAYLGGEGVQTCSPA
ncbi:MAG: ABC transporter ATP-binding protein [Deferrisomatales bacterium]|nr:ABC transporter ATP-binding protein [Deferrisomatales bacterium]